MDAIVAHENYRVSLSTMFARELQSNHHVTASHVRVVTFVLRLSQERYVTHLLFLRRATNAFPFSVLRRHNFLQLR